MAAPVLRPMEQGGSAKIKKSSSTAPEVPNSARPVLGIVGVTAFYPMTVVRTLAQVGYEPQPATIGPSLWTRTPGRYYPNLLSYANFLRKREGFTVLFTGLTPRIVSSLTSTAIEDAISAKIRAAIPDRSGDGDKSVRAKGLASTMYDMTVACAAKTVGVAVTQPLQVVMVRMICSIASEDQVYSGFFSTIKEIYQTEGFSGFFSGLVPRMVAEAGTIALSGTTMYLLYRIMESLGLNEEALESGSNYTSLVQLYMISLVYPLQLASVVTSASCRRLKLNIPDCSTWRGVYHQLTVMGQQYRGQNMFYRKAY